MNAVVQENARLRQQLRALQPASVTAAKARAIERLEALQETCDPEAAHQAADKALCEFLRALGHGEVADEFEAVERWYG